jgi:hypothetical protein
LMSLSVICTVSALETHPQRKIVEPLNHRVLLQADLHRPSGWK